MRIVYNVTPLMPVLITDKAWHLDVKDQSMSFWDFLNADIGHQLNTLAFLWLSRRRVIRRVGTLSHTVRHEVFETDSVIDTLLRHITAHVKIHGGYPSAIYLGADIHRALEAQRGFTYSSLFQGISIKVYVKFNMLGFFIETEGGVQR